MNAPETLSLRRPKAPGAPPHTKSLLDVRSMFGISSPHLHGVRFGVLLRLPCRHWLVSPWITSHILVPHYPIFQFLLEQLRRTSPFQLWIMVKDVYRLTFEFLAIGHASLL